MRLALAMLGALVASGLAACTSSLGAYPSCGDVYRLRPEEYGRVWCHRPASPERSAQATQDAIDRNADRRTQRAAILDAERAIEAGSNP